MNPFVFTDAETIPYIGLMVLIMGILISNYLKTYRHVWSPLTIVALIFGYYCILGPQQAVSSGKTMERLVNMRPYYESAFWGALVSLSFIIIGFNLNKKRGKFIYANNSSIEAFLNDYGKRITIIGFIMFTIYVGGDIAQLINPLDAEAVTTIGGSFANYLSLGVNLLIPGITLLFAYYLHTKKGLLWFTIPCIVSIGLFITLGFRFRIVLLMGAIVMIYFLIKGKKPNLVLAGIGTFLFIAFMGLINESRTYGRGLDLDKLDNSKKSFYESGLAEALIFQTSGAAIDIVPERHPHAGFAPITSALLFPIPRALFPEKGSADYLFNFLDALFGKQFSKGAAFMMYGEYYLAFGWVGIIFGSMLIGWFYKNIWATYLANPHNTIIISTYSVSVIFLYVIISRGYLPQVTMLFFFTVFPLYLTQRLARKKYKKHIIKTEVASRGI